MIMSTDYRTPLNKLIKFYTRCWKNRLLQRLEKESSFTSTIGTRPLVSGIRRTKTSWVAKLFWFESTIQLSRETSQWSWKYLELGLQLLMNWINKFMVNLHENFPLGWIHLDNLWYLNFFKNCFLFYFRLF